MSSISAKRNLLQVLKFGSFGIGVSQLQENLSRLGFHLRIDGDFGFATERSLMAFQRENCLLADGAFEPKTLEMMRRKLPYQD